MVLKRLPRSAWFLLAAAFIALTDSIIAHSFASEDRIVVYGVLFDFMLVIPLLYWLAYLRKSGKSLRKLLPIPAIGALAAWLVLPPDARGTVWKAAWPVELLIIAIEAAVLIVEIRIMARVFSRFRRQLRHEPDTVEAMAASLRETVGTGKFAAVLLHDFTMIYYLLFSWKRKRPARDVESTEGVGSAEIVKSVGNVEIAKSLGNVEIAKGAGNLESAGSMEIAESIGSTKSTEGVGSAFTYHRNNSQIVLAAMVSNILIVESAAVHYFVQQWSHWAAWILTTADLWLLAVIWADCRASVLQPIRLDADVLKLRCGLRLRADVPLRSIAAVVCSRELQLADEDRKSAATTLLGPLTVRIELKEPLTVMGLLFLPRSIRTIYVSVDDPQLFASRIHASMEQ